MDEQHRQVAGLHTRLIQDTPDASVMIVFLHGYGMEAADLTPFAHSLAIPGVAFAFPQAPTRAPGGGYSWWPIAEHERAARIERGPRDLAAEHPTGRPHARSRICALLQALKAEFAERTVVLAGFSQGGMLACDTLLFEPVSVAGLVMMSASCIAIDDWCRRTDRLRGLRAFVSHGRGDSDLDFSAGQRLEQFLTSSGAQVTWVPFDGGHAIPFRVWRQFRHFACQTLISPAKPNEKTAAYGTH